MASTVAPCRRLQKPCEAAARGDNIDDEIKISCTWNMKETDIVPKLQCTVMVMSHDRLYILMDFVFCASYQI